MSQSGLFLRIKDASLRSRLQQLELADFPVADCSDSEDWLDQLLDGNFDLIILDTAEAAEADVAQLSESKILADAECIFLSDGLPSEILDKATSRSGGFHFRAPYALDEVCEIAQDILADVKVEAGSTSAPAASPLDQYGLLVGSSRSMRKLYRTLRKVAASDANIMVVGESGVGKELVANTLHQASGRSLEPFVAVNCGALSPELVESELFGHVKGAFTGAHKQHEGLFAQAEGGTLFLDEVTEMSLDHQVKLLRVLETGEYRPLGSGQVRHTNVRVISATNREPEIAVADGIFREDLYFRLAQFPVRVPPLRDRGNDIVGLAQHFLVYRNDEEGTAKAFSDAALAMLEQHFWPGNVRELKYCIERAFILAEAIIEPEHIILDEMEASRGDCSPVVPAGVPLDVLERAAIESTLAKNSGNKTETAEQLGISVKTLYNKLDKYQKAELALAAGSDSGEVSTTVVEEQEN